MRVSIRAFTVLAGIAVSRPRCLLSRGVAVADAAIFQGRLAHSGSGTRTAHGWSGRHGALPAVGIGAVDGAVIWIAAVECAVRQGLSLGDTAQTSSQQPTQRHECNTSRKTVHHLPSVGNGNDPGL